MSLEVMLSDMGSTIQSLRKDRGLSQQELATGAGLGRDTAFHPQVVGSKPTCPTKLVFQLTRPRNFLDLV